MIINCPECKTSFNISDDKIPSGGGRFRCFNCKIVFDFEGPEKIEYSEGAVLIANESKAFCQTVSDLLEENGIEALVAYDGEEALSKVRGVRPAVVLIDVALPVIFGFDVCETIKNDDEIKATKIILIAAIYDKTQYKRSPSSLYGADEYIEKHHIHDRLVEMIWRLMGNEKGPEDKKGVPPVVQAVIPEDTEKEICESSPEKFEEKGGKEHDNASRLARIIVSDIALYNESMVMEGIKNNNLFELLKDDIAEGQKLFRQRVPEEIWGKRDYLRESLNEFIEKHSKLL